MICVEGMMGKGIFPYKVRTKRKFASALVNEHCLVNQKIAKYLLVKSQSVPLTRLLRYSGEAGRRNQL